MKQTKIIPWSLSLILLLLVSCDSKTIVGSGKITKASRPVSGFKKVSVSGSGEVDIEAGKTKHQIISISGSGDITVPNLKSEKMDITVSGSGKAEVWVTNKLAHHKFSQ